MVNLFLAVILQEFIQAQSMEAALEQEEERRDEVLSANPNPNPNPSPNPNPNPNPNQVLSARKHPRGDTPPKGGTALEAGSAHTASRSSSPEVGGRYPEGALERGALHGDIEEAVAMLPGPSLDRQVRRTLTLTPPLPLTPTLTLTLPQP